MRKITRLLFRLVLIVLFIILLGKFIYMQQMNYFYKTDYSDYVEKYAKIYDVDKELIYAIIKNESNFNVSAVSKVGAKGLMQIMDTTAEDVVKDLELENYDLFSSEDNIKIGTKYFSDLVKKYGETSLALAAYNAGFGTVDKWISEGIIKSDGTDYENIPYRETNMYVRKILKDYNIYIERLN